MKKLTTEDFINKAKLIHGNKYDYSKVEYINSKTNVIIICPIHGEFGQNPQSHYNGSECPICSKFTKVKSRLGDINKIKQSFIDKSNIIHNNKYNYDNVEYINSQTKVLIICPEHGEFWQTPNDHSQGHGCAMCVNLKKRKDISQNQQIDLSEYIIQNPIELYGSSEIIGSVYMFVNKTNNKKYIGKTISKISSRFSAHENKSKNSDYYFYKAIRKYSWEGFDKYVIFQTNVLTNNKVNKSLLNSIICDKEIEFINKFNTNNSNFGYNTTGGGEGMTGIKFSEETRKKMSESRKGEGNSMYGKTLEKNPRSIPILQLDKDGNIIKQWSCAVEIHQELGYSISMIRNCYNGKYEFYKEYKWIKKENYEK